MFLFRKKKETTETKIESTKTENVKAEVKKTAAAPPVKVVDKSAKARNEKESVETKDVPGRIVVPASALNEEAESREAAELPAAPVSQIPDEVADSLLVKVEKEGEKAEETEPVLNQSIQTESTGQHAEAAAPVNETKAEAAGQEAIPGPAPEESQPSAEEKPADAMSAEKPESTAETAPKAEEAPKEGEGDKKGNLFSELFGNSAIVEETPLEKLIKELPDISMEEVTSEAEEVKNLMNEFIQNQNR
jgi:hypothetical protein